MLHLAFVQNLLSAIGAAPHLARPACGNVIRRPPVAFWRHPLLGSAGRRRVGQVRNRRGGHPKPHLPATEVVMSTTVETATEIRPFHVDISDEALEDLRRRVAATNWPERETVADQSQGVPLAMIQELARYWATE
jgi:hypothetical protein